MRRFLLILLSLSLFAGMAHAEFIFADETAEQGAADEAAGILFESGDGAEAAPAGGVEILITAAGDVTIGGNMRKNPASTMYTRIMEANGGDLSIFFANVQEYFGQDDMTIVNFEGTLTESTKHKDNQFVFRAPKEHVQMLPLGSIEAVALENNHVMDFYEQGYTDTVEALEGAGIAYASEDSMGVYEVKGVSIAMLAYQTFDGAYPRLQEKVPQDVAAAKAEHDIVIVSYHWGAEGEFQPNKNQVALGRATIDAGADLVLGHHSHRINPIEAYNGKYIVYSLANCSFSGNTKPANMDTFLFQQKFTVTAGETAAGDFRIIPCSISSISGESGAVSADNDLVITPFAEGSDAAQRVIDTMLKNSKYYDNGRALEYAVTEYPTQWR